MPEQLTQEEIEKKYIEGLAFIKTRDQLIRYLNIIPEFLGSVFTPFNISNADYL